MNWMVENARWVAPLATFGSVYLLVAAAVWPRELEWRARGRHGFIAG